MREMSLRAMRDKVYMKREEGEVSENVNGKR